MDCNREDASSMKTRKSVIKVEKQMSDIRGDGTSVEMKNSAKKCTNSDKENGSKVCSICDFQTVDSDVMKIHLLNNHPKQSTDDISAEMLPDNQKKEEKEESKDQQGQKGNGKPAGNKSSVENRGNKLMELVHKLRINASVEVKPDADIDSKDSISLQVSDASPNNVPMKVESGFVNTPQTKDSLVAQPVRSFDRRTQRTPNTKKNFECDVCGYRAKWSSELQKHKLVHTNEKPFPCPHCTHRSRWKGDLTRHIQKIHKIVVQSQRSRKSVKSKVRSSEDSDKVVLLSQPTSLFSKDKQPNQNGNFMAFPGMHPQKNTDIVVNSSKCEEVAISTNSTVVKSSPILIKKLNSEPSPHMDGQVSNPKRGSEKRSINGGKEKVVKKLVYKCKECSFYTKTASRFHVHVVQHLNKKPYMCSDCGYRSNWQWDVTKHIRVKIEKLGSHKSAEVLLIDEAGEKNYDKYKPYMKIIEELSSNEQKGDKGNDTVTLRASPTSQVKEESTLLGANYICRQCGFGDANKNEVTKHAVEHLSKSIIDTNWRQTIDKVCIVEPRHQAVEDQIGEMFICCHCPYKTRKADFISFHSSQHRQKTNARFECLFCPYWVPLERNFLKHMSLHVLSPSEFLKEIDLMITCDFEQDNDESKSANDDGGDESSPKRRKFSCEYCPYTSNNRSQYLYHQQFHENGPIKEHKCTKCNYSVSHPHLLQQHLKLHENSPKEDEIDEESNESLEKNITKQVSENFLVGQEAPKSDSPSTSSGQMVKMYKCRYCPLVNKRRANVKTHELMHTKVKGSQYSCDLCNYKCDGQGALTSHLKIHDQRVNIYQINSEDDRGSDSNVQSVYLDESTVPRQRVKSANNILCKCKKCPSVFKTLNNLINHERFHGSDNPFKCDFCDYAAKFKPHLQNHMRVHSRDYNANARSANTLDSNVFETQERDFLGQIKSKPNKSPFQCSKCPAKFSKNSRLRRHESLHGADGKFTCERCAYSVNNSIAYQKHNQLHIRFDAMADEFSEQLQSNAPKQMRDDGCEQKQIDNRGWLQKSAEHVKVEQEYHELRLFSCTHCPYVHHRKDAVQNHLRRHIQQKGSFKCPYCDYNVLYDSFLKDHLKLHFVLPDHFTPKFKANVNEIEIKSINVKTHEANLVFSAEKFSSENDPISSCSSNEDGDNTQNDIVVKIEDAVPKKEDTEIIEDEAKETMMKISSNGSSFVHIKNEDGNKLDISEEKIQLVRDAQEKYMEAMKSVSNIEDVYSVINEFLQSGGSMCHSSK